MSQTFFLRISSLLLEGKCRQVFIFLVDFIKMNISLAKDIYLLYASLLDWVVIQMNFRDCSVSLESLHD